MVNSRWNLASDAACIDQEGNALVVPAKCKNKLEGAFFKGAEITNFPTGICYTV